MLTQEQNDLICRTGPGTPGGEFMRRYWQPVALAEELPPGGAPIPVELLSEKLTLYRDEHGNPCLIARRCPHRGADLSYGRVEAGGIRCLYHGWKMDVKGRVIEMVSEPAASCLASKVQHKAYPVKEWGGMVWAWLGPADEVPDFVPPPWAPHEKARVSIAKAVIPCNWAQILEGAIDSAHSSSLHSSDMVPARVAGGQIGRAHV